MQIWKDCGEPLSSRKKWVGKKFLYNHDWHFLKCLVKSNHKKSTVELTAMFNSESEDISMHTM